MPETKQKGWFRRHWILTGILILVVLGIIGGITSNSNKPAANSESTSPSEDFCRSIIPERINLLCHTTDNEINTGRMTCIKSPNETYSWNDGTPITGTIWFEKGWRTGENVNYLYLASYLGYEKTPTNADGTIGEKISYRIMWILDPNDQNADGFKVKSYKCCQSTKYNPCDILSTSYKDW